MFSRDISKLATEIRDIAPVVVEECEKEGAKILIYCTVRTLEEYIKLTENG